MEKIIDPIPLKVLLSELTEDRFLRYTNKSNNLLFVVNHHNAPNVMTEIGRLREITFRAAGGGTGKSSDIDHYDTDEKPYEQLIIWDPEDNQIIAGYRYIKCDPKYDKGNGYYGLATQHLFKFSDDFINNYLGKTIELGRSFVQPEYQADTKKGIFSLDNLWDGLGAIVLENPDYNYLFGKVTMYTSFNREARDLILFFMNYFFPDHEQLLRPHQPLDYETNTHGFEDLFKGLDYKEAHKILVQKVRGLGERVPPLVNSYMGLSSTMRTFGTAMNDEFGDVEETGIMVTISDIKDEKKARHLDTYERDKVFRGFNNF